MKKKIFFFSILLLFLIIFFNKKILTYFFIKNISHTTEYDANLNISKLNYISGILEINQIKLKNKENFFYENIFESNQIIIDFNYKSLFSNLVIINKMTLIDSKFFFEIPIVLDGRFNLFVFSQKIETFIFLFIKFFAKTILVRLLPIKHICIIKI